MTYHDTSAIRHTSVTIHSSSRALLRLAVEQFRSRGFCFSEQRLMRECLRFGLRFWRGRRGKSERNRRYNKRQGPYEIVPFYSTESLRAVAWARCHQSGISLSRIMDFAVRVYLPRVLEYWQRFAYRAEDREDTEVWARSYSARRHRTDFVISYASETDKNDEKGLSYRETTLILPWPPPWAKVA